MKPPTQNSWLFKAVGRLPIYLHVKTPIKKGRLSGVTRLEEWRAYRLYAPLSGDLVLRDGLRVLPGEVLILPQGWPLLAVSEPDQWIEFAFQCGLLIYQLGTGAGKIEKLILECHPSTPAGAELLSYFDDLIQPTKNASEVVASLRCQGTLNLLLARFLEISNGKELGTDDDNKGRRLYAQVRALIQSNLGKYLSLSDAARTLDCSPQHLNRLMQEYRQMSFLENLNFCRLEAARQLLQRSSAQIQELVGICGYRDINNFILAFSHHTGFTPGQWREQWRQAKDESRRGELLRCPSMQLLVELPLPNKLPNNKEGRCTLLFSNADDRDYEIYWLTLDGREVLMSDLSPGDNLQLGSEIGSFWKIKAPRREARYYMTHMYNCQIIITKKSMASPGAGPF